MTITEDEAREAVERVAASYGEAIIGYLNAVRDEAVRRGYTVNGPFDISTDDYRWDISIIGITAETATEDWANPDGQAVDVSFEIAEAHSYGDEPLDGLSFGTSITYEGGLIIGGKQPFNFTSECWVPASDAEAVAERWSYFADAADDAVAILNLIEDDVAGRKGEAKP